MKKEKVIFVTQFGFENIKLERMYVPLTCDRFKYI